MSIYSWGVSKHGETGSGEFEDVLDPMAMELLKGKRIAQIACGEMHSVALTDHGVVYAWGRGREGQMGNGSNAHKNAVPTLVQALRHERIVFVACGCQHTLAVTESGALYQWGKLYRHDVESEKTFGVQIRLPGMTDASNDRRAKLISKSHARYYAGDLSLTEVEESDQITNFGQFVAYLQKTPELVTGLQQQRVVTAAAGYSFSVCVTDTGEVWTFGFNEKFQLGLGHRFNQATPQRIKSLENVRIVQVAAGQQHCMALSADGDVYSWGLGVFGQLGHGGTADAHRPQLIREFRDRLRAVHGAVVQIAAGSHHSLALMADGTVFTFGSSEYGQQGGREGNYNDWAQGERGHAHNTLPTLLPIVSAANRCVVTQIACGHLFNFALTADGEVLSWGWGTSGALGHGNRRVQLVPQVVQRFRGESLRSIAAGSKHALAVTAGSSSTFAFDFKPFVNQSAFADLSFEVFADTPQHVSAAAPSRLFAAHRVVVFARCPHLRAMAAAHSRFVRDGTHRVPITHCRPHVFAALLHYLYTDHLKCPAHLLADLDRLAGQLRLPRLQQLCTRSTIIAPSSFRDDMLQMVNDPGLADVRLVVDSGASLYAHRVVLAARCEYFRTLFDSAFREASHTDLPLLGVGSATLLNVLEFLYGGDELRVLRNTGDNEEVNVDALFETLACADRLLLDDLKQICEHALVQTLQKLDEDTATTWTATAAAGVVPQPTHEAAAVLLELAHRYEAPRLRRVCVECLLSQKHFAQFWRSSVALASLSVPVLRELDFVAVQRRLIGSPGELIRGAGSKATTASTSPASVVTVAVGV